MNDYQKYKKSHEKYRKANREKLREKAIKYYWEHRAERLNKMKEYRVRKREELNQKRRDNYSQNIEEKRRQDREYMRNVREANLQKLGWDCCVCGNRRKKMVCHEIHGKSHSQSACYVKNHIEDFVLMCSWCHDTLHHYIKYRRTAEVLVHLTVPLEDTWNLVYDFVDSYRTTHIRKFKHVIDRTTSVNDDPKIRELSHIINRLMRTLGTANNIAGELEIWLRENNSHTKKLLELAKSVTVS